MAAVSFPLDPNDRGGSTFTLHLDPVSLDRVEELRQTTGGDPVTVLIREAVEAVTLDGEDVSCSDRDLDVILERCSAPDLAALLEAATEHPIDAVTMADRLRTDPVLAVIMSYCGPRGIPYLDFLRWDPISRATALAWHQLDAERCGSCGQRRDDWYLHDPDTGEVLRDAEGYPRVDFFRFQVVDHYCPACQHLANHRKKHREAEDGDYQHPRFVRVHPDDRPDPQGPSAR